MFRSAHCDGLEFVAVCSVNESVVVKHTLETMFSVFDLAHPCLVFDVEQLSRSFLGHVGVISLSYSLDFDVGIISNDVFFIVFLG